MTTPHLIRIDRSSVFNPVAFVGTDWSIAEQDEQALLLTEVDLSQVTFETMIRSGETSIGGEERLRRLKEAGCTRLDAQVLQALVKNQSLIPERWKLQGCIYFHGTILRFSTGYRAVLSLHWNRAHSEWHWSLLFLVYEFGAMGPSACLAS